MIEGYVLVDRRHDNICERFMEQRIRKQNNTEHYGMEDSLPFPVEPLRTTSATLPRNESVIIVATLESFLLIFSHWQYQYFLTICSPI